MRQQPIASVDAPSLGEGELPQVSRSPGAALILLRLPLPPVALVEARHELVSADPGCGFSLAHPGDVLHTAGIIAFKQHAAECIARLMMVRRPFDQGPQPGQCPLGAVQVQLELGLLPLLAGRERPRRRGELVAPLPGAAYLPCPQRTEPRLELGQGLAEMEFRRAE